MNLFQTAFPHLDGVVNSLDPAYLPTIPFKCQSALDKGSRDGVEEGGRDRDCEWAILDGPTLVSQLQAVFDTNVGLRLLVEDRTRNEQDTVAVAHALVAGIITDFMTADRAGDPSVTGILAILPVVGVAPTYTSVPNGVIVTAQFLIRHGRC